MTMPLFPSTLLANVYKLIVLLIELTMLGALFMNKVGFNA